jgi:hypothetical protein
MGRARDTLNVAAKISNESKDRGGVGSDILRNARYRKRAGARDGRAGKAGKIRPALTHRINRAGFT